ncbi:hypothetical protein EGW08_017383 [Elysia chlorotica]|uniref:Uncharacterized protein n=1 Tax=Elysia chlorotica TaxID=188477 RepID=A0A433T002_ELYCH|nr:hypothetical protein EGW08_017383 [Elysia chlorotica]
MGQNRMPQWDLTPDLQHSYPSATTGEGYYFHVFLLPQAYLRRLRTLHRAYVNKYKQLTVRQEQGVTSQPHRYQQQRQQQQQRQHQQQQRQHQQHQQHQRLRRPFVLDATSFKPCSHLKCCHDDERRRANLLYLGTKFNPAPVSAPAEGCLLHGPIPTKPADRPGLPPPTRFQENHEITRAKNDTKRFRVSHPRSCPSDTTCIRVIEKDAISSACESCCSNQNCEVPCLSSLTNKIRLNTIPDVPENERNYVDNGTVTSQVKSDPAAIRIPCGRDGSFCEPDTPRQAVNLVSLKLRESPASTHPLPGASAANEVLPFRAWKRCRGKLGGAFYSPSLNSLHQT